MTTPLSQVGHADWRSTSESVGFAPAPPLNSYAEFRRAQDEDFDKAADLALKFLESLDGAEALTLIDALHGVTGKDSEDLRWVFEKFVTRKW